MLRVGCSKFLEGGQQNFFVVGGNYFWEVA